MDIRSIIPKAVRSWTRSLNRVAPRSSVAAAHAPPWATHPLLQCSRRFVDHLIQQKEPSFTLLLVQSGSVPKAIELILNPPADVAPA
jgi:hypothetical protein